jgi:DNA-binding CsgD family transcriptional regulator
MRSPGRPIPARHVERAFWQLIAQGKRTEEAALEIGVSTPVAVRWFRHAGGMPPLSLVEPTGRYLSFSEREEIALLKAQGQGVREIARELRRDPGTISREVRRNAATRGGKPDYRASVAGGQTRPAGAAMPNSVTCLCPALGPAGTSPRREVACQRWLQRVVSPWPR